MSEMLRNNAVIDGELVEPKKATERELWIAGIHALADFYEAHSELPMSISSIDMHLFPQLEEMQKYIRIFGKAKKNAIGDAYFTLDKVFYEDKYQRVAIQATWNREQVCEKVKTGTKKVMQKVQVKPPEMIEVETEVETFEWRCPKVSQPKIAAGIQEEALSSDAATDGNEGEIER